MFTMPEAIAFGTLMLGGSGTAITALYRFKPSSNGSGKTVTNGQTPVTEMLCQSRFSALNDAIHEVKMAQTRIFEKLDDDKPMKAVVDSLNGLRADLKKK